MRIGIVTSENRICPFQIDLIVYLVRSIMRCCLRNRHYGWYRLKMTNFKFRVENREVPRKWRPANGCAGYGPTANGREWTRRGEPTGHPARRSPNQRAGHQPRHTRDTRKNAQSAPWISSNKRLAGTLAPPPLSSSTP